MPHSLRSRPLAPQTLAQGTTSSFSWLLLVAVGLHLEDRI